MEGVGYYLLFVANSRVRTAGADSKEFRFSSFPMPPVSPSGVCWCWEFRNFGLLTQAQRDPRGGLFPPPRRIHFLLRPASRGHRRTRPPPRAPRWRAADGWAYLGARIGKGAGRKRPPSTTSTAGWMPSRPVLLATTTTVCPGRPNHLCPRPNPSPKL